jgi:dTDP-L-rhamnose 4-epimerase
VLITGGAGFIGSHLADELLAHGYRVRVVDCLVPRSHGDDRMRPGYLARDVELLRGDVRDRRVMERALRRVDAVFHLAPESSSLNDFGTAVLLESLTRRPVETLVFTSSMDVYGEGLYRTADGRIVEARARTVAQLELGRWDVTGPQGEPLEPLPTPETAPAAAGSVVALAKHDQERLCLMVGAAYRIPTVVLRLFSVYGPRQGLRAPDGVLATFAARLLAGEAPDVLEDGLQQRDLVSVHDVVRACRLALESNAAAGRVFNVGSGSSMTIRTVAAQMAEALGRRELRPQITGRYRLDDVRHCLADTTLAAKVLGYEARISFTEGLLELAEWLARQRESHVAGIAAPLEARGPTG